MDQLTGKTALVTGATSGIGLVAAQRLAAEGAHVFITGRGQSGVDDAVASIGDSATGVRGDITEPADLNELADAIRAYGHGLDVVFANAGGVSSPPWKTRPVSIWPTRSTGTSPERSSRCRRCYPC